MSNLVRLLQLASPALPIGGYSYSQGLEWMVETRDVRDAASAQAWIGEMLDIAMARCEAPVVVRLGTLARPRRLGWLREMACVVSCVARNLGIVGRVAADGWRARQIDRGPRPADDAARDAMAGCAPAHAAGRVRFGGALARNRAAGRGGGLSLVVAREPGAGRDQGRSAWPGRGPEDAAAPG
jgi:hypothetical protein